MPPHVSGPDADHKGTLSPSLLAAVAAAVEASPASPQSGASYDHGANIHVSAHPPAPVHFEAPTESAAPINANSSAPAEPMDVDTSPSVPPAPVVSGHDSSPARVSDDNHKAPTNEDPNTQFANDTALTARHAPAPTAKYTPLQETTVPIPHADHHPRPIPTQIVVTLVPSSENRPISNPVPAAKTATPTSTHACERHPSPTPVQEGTIHATASEHATTTESPLPTQENPASTASAEQASPCEPMQTEETIVPPLETVKASEPSVAPEPQPDETTPSVSRETNTVHGDAASGERVVSTEIETREIGNEPITSAPPPQEDKQPVREDVVVPRPPTPVEIANVTTAPSPPRQIVQEPVTLSAPIPATPATVEDTKSNSGGWSPSIVDTAVNTHIDTPSTDLRPPQLPPVPLTGSEVDLVMAGLEHEQSVAANSTTQQEPPREPPRLVANQDESVPNVAQPAEQHPLSAGISATARVAGGDENNGPVPVSEKSIAPASEVEFSTTPNQPAQVPPSHVTEPNHHNTMAAAAAATDVPKSEANGTTTTPGLSPPPPSSHGVNPSSPSAQHSNTATTTSPSSDTPTKRGSLGDTKDGLAGSAGRNVKAAAAHSIAMEECMTLDMDVFNVLASMDQMELGEDFGATLEAVRLAGLRQDPDEVNAVNNVNGGDERPADAGNAKGVPRVEKGLVGVEEGPADGAGRRVDGAGVDVGSGRMSV